METSLESIILFSKNTNLAEIKSLKNIKKIISFDFDSHKLLSTNNIKHDISDNYLDTDDLRLIQKLSYKLSKWFANDHVSKILEYEGINLGSLIQVELNYFLVQFVKKYFEILKITRSFPDSSFIVSKNLYDLVQIFSKKVSTLDEKTDLKNDFYYDSVHIPLKISNKTFKIKISNDSYKKIKNLFDKTINLLYFSKISNNYTSNNSILLIEFDIIRYKSIFDNLPKTNLDLAVYNRRSPTIRNFQSYSIIKKSGSKIINSSSLLDTHLTQKISNDKTSLSSIISTLFDQEDYFKNFFSINQQSFWSSLKSIFQSLIKKRFYEFIEEIQLVKRILEQHTFSSILVLSEIGSTEQIFVKLAKKFKISVVVLQHGLFFDSSNEGAFDMNEFQGVFPHDADYYIVWGDIEKNHAITGGVPTEKIIPLGSPLFDNLPSGSCSEEYVLLATSGPVQENAFDITISEIEKNRQVIHKICSVVNQMGKKLIIKIHPSPDEFDPTKLAQSINSQFVVFKTGDISELIKNSSVFIVIDVSTVMLNAQIMKKPVISIITKNSDYGFPSIITSQSCVSIRVNDLEKTLNSLFTDKQFYNSIVKKGESYSKQYVVNQGNSALKILEFLNSLQRTP